MLAAIISIIIMFLADNVLAKNQPIQLKSIYHHIGAQKSAGRLELGNVILFFSSPVLPAVLHKKTVADNVQEYRILFAHVMLADAHVQELIERMRSTIAADYNITVESVTKPLPGLMLTIQFDPQSVLFQYDSLVSNNALPGYIFRFINKKLQQDLTNKVTQKRLTSFTHNTIKPCVVIDPGHGGHDIGTTGCGLLQEKDLTLKLGKRVGSYLRAVGCDVLLTRTTDRLIMLEERSARANGVGADLFVSIHANAAVNERALGIETFYYPHAHEKSILCSEQCVPSTVQTYLQEKERASCDLASTIQQRLISQTVSLHPDKDKIDRSVKTAPFQVLIGTAQPSVLVEVGFISNPHEAQLLSSAHYQRAVAQGIAQGIVMFLKNSGTVA